MNIGEWIYKRALIYPDRPFLDQGRERIDNRGFNEQVNRTARALQARGIRRGERVAALMILNSPHERGAEAQALVEQRALDSAAGGPGATLDATIERWFTPEFRAAHDDYIQRVRGWVLANDAHNYALAREVLAFGVVELIRPQPPIAKPALVMTCENDSGSTPAMSQAIASEIDGAEVIIVPGLKHMGLAENPGFFINALAEFLDSVEDL